LHIFVKASRLVAVLHFVGEERKVRAVQSTALLNRKGPEKDTESATENNYHRQLFRPNEGEVKIASGGKGENVR
jgi:hypothetical protein